MASLLDLQNEIAFYNVMLRSIDAKVPDRERAEAEVKDTLKSLKRQYRELSGAGHAPSSPIDAASSQTDRGLANTSPAQASTAAVTPGRSTILPSRKRSCPIGLTSPHDTKRHARGSSSDIRPSTPAADTSSDDDFLDFNAEFFRAHEASEERRKQEARDAEFARSIQDELSDTADPIPGSRPRASEHVNERTAFSQMSNGMRPHPGSIQPSRTPQSGSSSLIKPESQFHAAEMGASGLIKEQTAFSHTSNGMRQHPSYIQSSRTPQTPGSSSSIKPEPQPHATKMGASGSTLPLAMYGGRPTPSWMNSPSKTYQTNSMMFRPGAMDMSPYAYPRPDQIIYVSDSDMSDSSIGYGGSLVGLQDPVLSSEATRQELQNLLDNIKPDEPEGAPLEAREQTPAGLKSQLYEHQKIALKWLKDMENGYNKGGILADDMGLGKTISSLALILARPSTDARRKTTLIVGPVALVRQWEKEIRTKIRGAYRLSTYMYYGQKKKPSFDVLKTFDIVLTSYGTMAAEYKRFQKFEARMRELKIRDWDLQALKADFPLLSPNSHWYRIILDEAQCIKNKGTGAAKAACQLSSSTRWCLTGTPMMNSVEELYSLIKFLRIRPYNEWQRFRTDFGCLTKGRDDTENAMKMLQAVLKAILLRRKKDSKIDGGPIITLPAKTEQIQYVAFNDEEAKFYKALEANTALQINRYMKRGTLLKNYANVLVLLLRLRQCCCHPHLIMDLDPAGEVNGGPVHLSLDVMADLARSLAPEVIARLIVDVKASSGEEDVKVFGDSLSSFECPVCYEVESNPSIIVPCGHDTCRTCLEAIHSTSLQDAVRAGHEHAGSSARCPRCRGRLEMNKLVDLNTFKRVHMPDSIKPSPSVKLEMKASESEDNSDSGSDSDSGTESDEEDEMDETLGGFLVPDDISDTDEGEEGDDEGNNTGTEETQMPKDSHRKKHRKDKRRKSKGKTKGKGKEKEDVTHQHLSLAMLKKDAARSKAHHKQYMKYLKKHYEPSTKIDKTMELLREFQTDGHKTIIFSQFVSFLDLLQIPIDRERWVCERYDGGMKADERNDAINRFTDRPEVKIMLVSLKAGNAGLNLVAASRVIIMDPFWNPYIEMQAVDRAYRIGQLKEVEVHRILMQESVETRIMDIQAQKKALVEAALDENEGRKLTRLGTRELAFLFGVGRNHGS